MHTLLALMLTVVASVVIARPPGPVSTAASQEEVELPPSRKYLKEYLLPRFLWPPYFAYDETPQQVQVPRQLMSATEWLNQEIERLSRMEMEFKPEIPMPRNPSHVKRWLHTNRHGDVEPYDANQQWPAWNLVSEKALQQRGYEMNEVNQFVPASEPLNEDKKKMFALTPRDLGYFEPSGKETASVNLSSEGVREGGDQRPPHEGSSERKAHPELDPEPPRITRQNPNLSRHHLKSLVAEDLDDLRRGFVPGHEELGSRDNSRHVSVLESATGGIGTFYGVALLSAIGAAAVLALLGFAIGWYTLSKRAKAAADVDYPAYGVTGPTIDTSGDRKLAHSAHMYHYQHQKQQIIAMERSGMEQGSGSVSDPESDDENEEGDYTVYECPGFATTGDMEVKNPLFNEDPTPATPGKCEVVKPQPKD